MKTNQERITSLASEKLPTSSLERVGLTFFNILNIGLQSDLEYSTQQVSKTRFDISATKLDGYHLHCIPGSGNRAPIPKANQICAYVDGINNELKITYLVSGQIKVLSLHRFVLDQYANSPEDKALNRIYSKIQSNRPLTTEQITLIEEKTNSPVASPINAVKSVGNKLFGMIAQTTEEDSQSHSRLHCIKISQNPLLKSMDEYIHSLRKKATADKMNKTAAKDKIALTNALIKFVENPNQANWSKVRATMNAHSMYAFTGTGQSQAYTYLNTIKALYQDQIDGVEGFDAQYNKCNYWHSNNAWGQFFLHLGCLNYLFGIPEAVYNMLSSAITAIASCWMSYKLGVLMQSVQRVVDSDFISSTELALANLQAYLDGSPGRVNTKLATQGLTLQLTEDDVSEYIKNFTQNYHAIIAKGPTQQKCKMDLLNIYIHIKAIVGEDSNTYAMVL
ncbi:MAG: hypothetical protein Q8R24_08490 [Legionellaceae bacterium]|nr:hypothetical protein [Legionellaceae bacterium]